jgi:hypothetical protein
LAYVSSPAWAADITVTTKAGGGGTAGNCSLRQAIKAANTCTGADDCAAGSATERDAILFSLGEQATIKLGSTLPTITDDAGLTINGQQAKITISGNDSVQVLVVGSGAKLNLNRLTVADGISVFDGMGGGDGGGLRSFEGSVVKVTNSTFSGNSAEGFGGGIANECNLEVTNSTFSANGARLGSGIASGIFSGTATLRNTIVANSTRGSNCYTGSIGPTTDGGYNIADDDSCSLSAANNSLPSTDPLLASSLANNGGPTKTMKLLQGSPAKNAIPNATNGCGTEITTDQRGVSRPQGKGCDVGAFEKEQP